MSKEIKAIKKQIEKIENSMRGKEHANKNVLVRL